MAPSYRTKKEHEKKEWEMRMDDNVFDANILGVQCDPMGRYDSGPLRRPRA